MWWWWKMFTGVTGLPETRTRNKRRRLKTWASVSQLMRFQGKFEQCFLSTSQSDDDYYRRLNRFPLTSETGVQLEPGVREMRRLISLSTDSLLYILISMWLKKKIWCFFFSCTALLWADRPTVDQLSSVYYSLSLVTTSLRAVLQHRGSFYWHVFTYWTDTGQIVDRLQILDSIGLILESIWTDYRCQIVCRYWTSFSFCKYTDTYGTLTVCSTEEEIYDTVCGKKNVILIFSLWTKILFLIYK